MPGKIKQATNRSHRRELSRREFIERIAGAGAVAAVATFRQDVWAQAAETAKTPPEPAGTVSNTAVLADKNPALKPHSDRPLTASVPAEEHNFAVTPNDRMFIRNNLLTPDIDAGTHRLVIKGLVDKELTFSLDQLRASFPVVTMQGMLECAGSGRAAFVPAASGTPWSPTGGMGCPRWTGVRLRDVLKSAGLANGAAHVSGQGGDFGAIATAAPVIRSVPLAKAMEENTLIAFAMNDVPLPKIHGYPMRLVVPGWVGSASTKWLHTITVLPAPFKGPYMDSSYRVPRLAVKPGEKMPATL
jgi:DMSO/TMAO reductase YedYZ molybdopterin-dependent catalytic subunit